MGIKITFQASTMSIDFNGESNDHKSSRTKLSSIRSLTVSTDNKSIEVVLNSGAIYPIDFNNVESIDTDTSITSQEILRAKLDAKIFP